MKIVLAVDGSDFSKVAIKKLAKFPLPQGSEISIINVYEHPAMSTPELISTTVTLDVYYQEFIANAEKIGKKIVSEAGKVLKEKNRSLLITTNVISGLPKREILEKAESFDADLIVVGSQGQGAFSRLLLGSVSQYLATHAKCSVLIVKEKENA
ncbi:MULTISPECIES: universal stress protein [Flavobacteriaceae]|uniref:Nucleotide-binding universal stress UspA family protein n=1 Tax=Gillisia mitskevichiae TaxID=270921 RepID=A0A495PYB4_9FLAO|nr:MULTISPECIES: universal stress protein [Flavobacteriaceae]RKS55667.1 nucleotide-binding universal stress UspA family protein [Gillisia mitskevichiae]|tara:strand:- start:746 stop:1207 length:462 start_codon:yes stop_codon:yes gene_type:complete